MSKYQYDYEIAQTLRENPFRARGELRAAIAFARAYTVFFAASLFAVVVLQAFGVFSPILSLLTFGFMLFAAGFFLLEVHYSRRVVNPFPERRR